MEGKWKGFGALYAPLRSELPGFWERWHTFSTKWHHDKLEFFLDGDKTPTYTKEAARGVFIADMPQKIIFDQDVQPVDGDWFRDYDANTTFSVEWVRVYRQCTAP